MNCLQGFTQELSRDQHQAYCEDNEPVRVEMPKQGSTVEFKDGQNQFKVPFIMYADFESILEPMGPGTGISQSTLCISQFQVRTSPPQATPGVLHLFSSRVPGICAVWIARGLLGGRTYYQSTKLSVDAV